MPTSERPIRGLLIAPYFLPRNYGGAAQLYDGRVRGLKTLEMTVLSERQGTAQEGVAQFDREAPSTRGYALRRMTRLCFHLRYGSTLANLADAAWFVASSAWRFRRIVRTVRPDIVICGETYTSGWLLNLVPREIARMNFVLGEELTQEITGGALSRLLRRQQVRALRGADANLALSRFTAMAARDLAGLSLDRIQLQPGCIDTDRFRAETDREALRRKWGWSERTVMLTVARLVPRKGVDRVLTALAQLRTQGRLGPDWLYCIGGRGPELEKLRSLTVALELEQHVRFLGFVPDDDLPGLYSSADVFILANRDLRGDTEGFGLVFLEANACGLPVIGGRAGGTAEAIEEGVTGLRVDSEDLDILADSIALLMRDPEMRSRMGTAGAERVVRQFSMKAGSVAFEDALRRCILEHRGAQV